MPDETSRPSAFFRFHERLPDSGSSCTSSCTRSPAIVNTFTVTLAGTLKNWMRPTDGSSQRSPPRYGLGTTYTCSTFDVGAPATNTGCSIRFRALWFRFGQDEGTPGTLQRAYASSVSAMNMSEVSRSV